MRTRWMLGLLSTLFVVATAHAQEAAPAAPTAAADGYAWDKACATCHKAIHDSWAATKHAKTWGRLSNDDRQKDCAGCHLTGPKTAVTEGGPVLNANVQCESCHGPGKAHAEAAAAGNPAPMGLKKSPPESSCTPCHNDKSPHYRGFYFAAMKSLSHKK